MGTSLKTYSFSEIVDERERAVQLKIDGKRVWLPKGGLQLDKSKRTVAHSLLEGKLAEASQGDTCVDLGAPAWESERSFGYDIYVSRTGDRTNEVTVRVFVAKSLMQDDGVPMWLITKRLREEEIPANVHVLAADDQPIPYTG